MPTYQVRPTLHVGYFSWRGSAIVPNQDPLVALDAPSQVYVEAGPGVEVSAGRYLNVFLRGHAEIPISGNTFQDHQTGTAGALEDFEEPVGTVGGGWGIQAGLQVRIPLLAAPDERALQRGFLDDADEEPDF